MDTLISFDDLKAGAKALKKLAQAFMRAGTPVAATDVDPKTKRTSGMNYRVVLLTFADNQKVQLGVKTTGDIFEVKINGSVLPIKAQDDQRKAVAEIVKALDSGRAKFQAKLARQKVALPKGITTAAPKMEQKLAQASADLDDQIAKAKTRVNELRAELGEPALDSAGAVVLDAASLHGFIGKPAKDEKDKVLGKVTGVRVQGAKKLVEVDGKRVIVARDVVPFTDLDNGGAEHLEVRGFYTTMTLDGRTLDAVDVPTNTFDDPEVLAAQQIAQQVNSGMALDAAAFPHALATLQIALDTVETNYPINLAEGDLAQAELEERAAEDFRAAIKVLEAQQVAA